MVTCEEGHGVAWVVECKRGQVMDGWLRVREGKGCMGN